MPIPTGRLLALILVCAASLLVQPSLSRAALPAAIPATEPAEIGAIVDALSKGSFDFVDDQGTVIATRRREDLPPLTLSLRMFTAALQDGKPSGEQVALVWETVADDANAGLVILPIVKALAAASTTPQARETLWSELADIARNATGKPRDEARARTLLTLFERHRSELLPLLPAIRETEGGGDGMAHLMTSTTVFGGDIWLSLFDMVVRNPAAVARMIERERGLGRPVKWEFQGFEGLMRWKDAHLIPGAPKAPRTLKDLDETGETFISLFNALHSLDEWYRTRMLQKLGPVEVFNAAVSGEQELYRLGTSSYREFLHPVIMKGIKASGSFEAFLDKALPRFEGETTAGLASRRGLVFVRIASSFGLLESVLETVRDREQFIASAIAELGDPRSFESSGSIVVDLVTGQTTTPQALAFKRVLLERLYALYTAETEPSRRSVYGSMLSAYQTVTGDRRSPEIDRAFPLDPSLLQLPFDRLFKPNGRSGHVHRIFMRVHDDIDAVQTYGSFRILMRSLGASVREEKNFVVFKLSENKRTVEIYTNKPNSSGVRQGIAEIGKSLKGNGIDTIVGRGHTGIITPLKADSRKVAGDRMHAVAAVIVGTCGGDASVRDLVSTFGYVPFIATKSTGRQILNNAIMESYIEALLDMKPGQTLSLRAVLDEALEPYLKPKAEDTLREHAKLYQVNLAMVYVLQLFDKHVRQHAVPQHAGP